MIEPKPAMQAQPSDRNGQGAGPNGTDQGKAPAKAARKRRFGGTATQIRSALKFYKVMAYLTGTMLLLLCAELVVRYAFGQYLFAGGTNAVTGQPFGLGFAAAEPLGVTGGVNLSVTVLIVHGWMYVVYLMSNFRLWSLMRWPFAKLILLALGGVIPFLSFIVEKKFHADVEAELAANPQAAQRY
jgi:integral membrane protein